MRGSGLETVLSAITQTGLVPRGAFLLSDEDRRGALASVRAIVLAGMAGRDGWSAFAASPEAADGADHPLDRWSRRVIEGSGARPRRARPVPLRRTAVLAVPAMGAALGAGASLADRSPDPSALRTLAQLPRSARVSGGARCSRTRGGAKSVRLLPRTLVLEYMPRRRVLGGGYDVAACAGHLKGADGADCMDGGCRARRACPVGAAYVYGPDQASFTMRAFLRAREAR